MPGILPMKIIKGSNSQTRIAQACDRCRSKKIKCDGGQPACSSCVAIGFECKTSDKLSRRAFPRGYTESLEERVRSLEAEVRDLKRLLDEKDEKLDMLSRIRSGSSLPAKSMGSVNLASLQRVQSMDSNSDEDEVFKISQSDNVLYHGTSEAIFMGLSSARPLVGELSNVLQQRRKISAPIDINSFFNRAEVQPAPITTSSYTSPARLLSDKLVNIFFQEFSPLFPILHRPTFLQIYDQYCTSPTLVDNRSLAQLNLVFAIASLSKQSGATNSDMQSFESQWKHALDWFASEDTQLVVQCLSLATLFYMRKAEYGNMLRYKGQAVALSQRLGLHQSHNNYQSDPLTVETRKKTFWSLVTLDAFSAAHLGLPTLFSDNDIQCELPIDADDEYISENGFLPTLPGESTKLSSALALFRLSRITLRILKELYSGTQRQKLSFRIIAAMQDELDTWSSELAPHLRLQFEKDKPSTAIISSRTPLLSLAYHYTHTLISRPAVLAASTLQSRSNASIHSLALSSKKMIQIIELLEERNMAFAFCLNKNELLTQAAFGLLFQSLEIGSDSAVSREDSKLFGLVLERMESDSLPGAAEFRKILEAFIKGRFPKAHRKNSNSSMKSSQTTTKASKRSPKASLVREESTESEVSYSIPNSADQDKSIFSMPTIPIPNFSNSSNAAYSYMMQTPVFARSEPTLSPSNNATEYPSAIRKSLANINSPGSTTDWEQLLSNLDNNVYGSIYGGPSIPSLKSASPDASHTEDTPCSPSSLWNIVSDTAFKGINAPCSTKFGSDGGDEMVDTQFLLDNQNAFGLNSPAFLNNGIGGIELFDGLAFSAMQ